MIAALLDLVLCKVFGKAFWVPDMKDRLCR